MHKPSGHKKSFKNRTEFKKSLREQNKPVTDDYIISDKQESDTEENCNKSIANSIKNIVEAVDADSYELFVGGEDNFRNKLLLPSKYKGNREDSIRPLLLKSSKEFLINSYKAEVVNGKEADDMLSIRGYEYLKEGHVPILGTNDKDQRQGSGLYIYDFTKEKPVLEIMPEFGALRCEVKGKNQSIKGEGFLFGCWQWLAGDSTDNFCPYELAGASYGEKSAFHDLSPCQSEKEALGVVLERFRQWYPTTFEYATWDGQRVQADWEFIMNLYFQCFWMLRSEDDKTTGTSLMKEYDLI